jgi:hypothetical protein
MKRIFNSRRDHVLARVCVFMIVAALIAGMIGCVPISGNLEIQDWYDLDDVRDNLAGSHILMNNLDSTSPGYQQLASPTANGGKGWQPIGNGDRFTGSFDGQGYEIRDLYINRLDANHVGLFGFVDDEGVIQDIGVVNATVTGQASVGGLVGFTRGTVSNSYSTGNVMGQGAIGGLVGWNIEGTVRNSHSSGSVTGHSSVGGLVGYDLKGTVSNSYATGNVTGSSEVGGFVGRNSEGTVSNSYSTGSVTGNSSVGGLLGLNDEGNVSNSHYNNDEVLINGENIITIGALFDEDFEEWLANSKFLDVDERLSEESGYYVISDITDFKQLLAFGQDDALKFKLANDIDLDTEPGFYIPYLAGEFDGNGHKISNLSFNFDFVSNVGLFGYLTNNGKVTDLAAEKVNITGYCYVGGLVGWNIEGTVSNSYSTGSVIGGGMVAGLVGMNSEGIVSNSYSTSNVTGGGFVGGLVGINYKGTVSDSHSNNSVAGWFIVGGLVGMNDGTVRKSYSSGSVTSDGDVGGLVGTNGEGTISYSYSTSSVTCSGPCVGGLVGRSDGYSSTMSNSYSTGSVTGNSSVGGLVGLIVEGNVSKSYSTGNVTGVTDVGGLIGENEGEGTISNSFWDTQTSGQTTSDGGTGKTTAQMQDIATFSGAAWNIIAVALNETNPTYIWNIVDNVTYPFLSWQP